MLQAMRGTAGSWVVKILFVFLIASFAFWGVNDIFLGQGQNVNVAEVGDTDISAQQLETELNRYVQRYQPQGMNRNLAVLTGAPQQLLQQMVNGALLEEKLSNLNITVSDLQVKEEIKKYPFFQGEDGNFDPERFRQVLRSQNSNEEAFVNSVRSDLSRQLLLDLMSRQIVSPDVLTEGMLAYQNEKRKGQFVWFQFSDQQPEAATDEQLKTFFDENSNKYQQAENRNISFINVTLENVIQPKDISAEDLQAAFDARQDEFITIPKRKLWQVIVSDEEKAKKLSASDLAGFKATVEAEKLGTAQDLGWKAEEELFGDSKDHVFAGEAKTGTLAPLKTAFGWTVFFVEASQKGGEQQKLADVEQELRQSLAADLSFERVSDMIKSADESLAAGNDLAETAKVLNVTVENITALEQSGKNNKGEEISNLPQDPNFLSDVFAMNENEAPAVTETDAGGFFIAQVTKIDPAKTKEYDSVVDQVKQDWLTDTQKTMATENAEQALKEITDSAKSLQDIADQYDLLLRSYTNLGRNDEVLSGIEGRQLVTGVFGLEKDGFSTAQTNEGVAVLTYQEKIPFEGQSTDAEKDQISTQLTQQLHNDINQAFLGSLRDQISVTINDDIMARYFSPGGAAQNMTGSHQ